MKFIIYGPQYRNSSAGIRVLHRMAALLNERGYSTVCHREKITVPPDTIVIYPEITRGNPLNARRVVRYILNVPGFFGGPLSYPSSDLLVAYAPDLAVYSGGELLSINVIEDFFRYDGEIKKIDCVWIGKGKNTSHPAAHGAVEITRQWPANRQELSELLKQTRILYTYDNYTALITEASRCGCKVIYLDTAKPVQLIDSPPDFSKEPEQLQHLIERCQKLLTT